MNQICYTLVLYLTGQGFYVYIEASSPRVAGDIARLESDIVPYTFPKMCVDFWYHMYGDQIGTLNVYFKAGGQLGSPVWERVGSRDDRWYRGQILYYPTSDFQVRYPFLLNLKSDLRN